IQIVESRRAVFRHDANAISVRTNRLQRPDFKEKGDSSVRAVLYEAGHLILTRPLKGCTALKSWAMRIAKRAGSHLALEPRSARTWTRLRAREFTGDQLAVPGQDRVRPGDGCDLGKNLATQAITNLAERGSLGVREHQSNFQLVFQDAVFGVQIF